MKGRCVIASVFFVMKKRKVYMDMKEKIQGGCLSLYDRRNGDTKNIKRQGEKK